MFYSDLTANIPAAGIAGRIFIATDSPYGLFRDTGSAWEQIAGSGGGGGNTIYTANDTLTGNRIVSSGGFDLSFTSTTYIGTAAIGSGSGKLIVGSSTADNGIQIFGANAPSIRVDNAQSGGTQRLVIGLSTAINNFIQGSTSGDICISSASASPILFGMWQTINADEVMRISTSSNLLIGSTTDTGQKLQVTGIIRTNSNSNSIVEALSLFNSNTTGLTSGQSITYRNTFSSAIQASINLIFDSGGGGLITFNTSTNGTSSPTTKFTINKIGIISNLVHSFPSGLNAAGGIDTQYQMTIGVGTLPPDPLPGYLKNAYVYMTANLGVPASALTVLNSTTSPVNFNAYGIYVTNNSTVSGTGIKYGIYSNAGVNVFTDNTIFGGTLNAGYKIDVNGSTRLNGTLRIDGQSSVTSGGSSGQHLIINLDGTTYKIALLNP